MTASPTTPQTTSPEVDRQDPFRWSRSHSVHLLHLALHDDDSLNAFAREHDLPPSTLAYWKRRHDCLEADPDLRCFFESPAGLAFLRAVVVAAHLVFHQAGLCGLRPLCAFFRYAGLAPFLACSFSAQQRLSVALRQLIVRYGREQRQELAQGMPRRDITLCQDETFHRQRNCLVAIEPVSNFILLESYQKCRDAQTWNAAVKQALGDLPVTVTQGASDEAKGILAHVRDGLGAHHSPDLMHLQQDLHRSTSLPLRRQLEAAQEASALAQAQAAVAIVARLEYDEGPPRPGRRPDFEARVEAAKEQLRQARQKEAECQRRQEQVKEAIRGLGDDYHPFDATTGAAVSPEGLQERLGRRLGVVEQAAEEADLSEKSQKKIGRVRRLLPTMVATLAWFWLQVRWVAQQQGWTAPQQELFAGPLLGWAYWEAASGRGRDAAQKKQLRQVARRCREEAEASAVWQGLSEEERERMERLAKEVAGRWVRSSSCVEGRNGVLRLRHHGRQGLSPEELEVLTVLHNYGIEREDGTTAAERFFGKKPADLFGWLSERFPELPRPARPRKKAA